MRKGVWSHLATALWAAGVLSGTLALADYASTPGPRGEVPPSWPPALGAHSGRFELLVFVHPRCPCTRATLWELAELHNTHGPRFQLRVYFELPPGCEADWARTDLWDIAAAIPGARLEVDREGALARRLGVETSGHALLYSPRGALRLDGGLTISRGHQGDSEGLAQIRACLEGRRDTSEDTPIYGCELRSPVEETHARD